MFYHVGQVLGNLLSSLILGGGALWQLVPDDHVDHTLVKKISSLLILVDAATILLN